MIRIVIITISLLATMSCQNTSAESNSEKNVVQQSPLVSPDEFAKLSSEGNAVVLDVRSDREVAAGIIEGAVQLNFQDPQFTQKLQELDKSKVYLVYCASGGRSSRTQKAMFEMGFKEVYDLNGGIRAWSGAGKKVVKPD